MPVYHPANSTASFTLPLQWSNYVNACVVAAGEEFPSPGLMRKHTVQGSILAKYRGQCSTAGACTGVLGASLSEETVVGNAAGGRVSYFSTPCSGTARGPNNSCSAIYFSNATGPQAIWGADFLRYLGANDAGVGGPAGKLGFPVSDPDFISGGAISYFAGPCAGNGPHGSCAAIYAQNGATPREIWGGDYLRYLAPNAAGAGGPTGVMGWPVSDPIYRSGGAVSYFEGPCSGNGAPAGGCAAIYSKSGIGDFEVWGGHFLRYVSLGEETGWVGWPVSDPIYIAGGAASYFRGVGPLCRGGGRFGSGVALYSKSGGTTREVHGCILQAYENQGGPPSLLGFPVSDEYAITGGRRSDFERGFISYNTATGQTAVVCTAFSCRE